MAIRNKLYYDITLSTGLNTLIKAICASTGADFGSASVDRYSNVLAPNQFNGASGNIAKCRQAIGAWFVPSFASGDALAPARTVVVDFLLAGTVTSIDPATTRRPRVRVRALPAFASAATNFIRGTLYVQRQNSIEV